jgi:hypothetical protein
MSQYVETPTKTDVAAAAIAQHLRVKTTGALAVAGATDVELGTMEEPCTAAGTCVIRLRTAAGTCKMVASAAITAGVTVYAAASGKIASSGSVVIGTALEAATANNDVIEVLRHADVGQAFTSQTLIAAADSGAGSTILPGTNAAYVDAYTTDANDWIVLPALASVENGFTITVVGQAQGNFEVRTPAASGEEINSEDCDGTKEYLFTNTQIHKFIKIDNTIGWMAHGFSALGAVVTAVVPD